MVSKKHYNSSRKAEVKLIQEYITQIIEWVRKKHGEEVLSQCLSNDVNGFRTFVECTAFFTNKKKMEWDELKETKPFFATHGWADQPRLHYFDEAWDTLGLPETDSFLNEKSSQWRKQIKSELKHVR